MADKTRPPRTECVSEDVACGVASPCIGTCTMDDTLGHCLGCGRTRVEIGRWLALTNEQKRAVVQWASARVGRPVAGEGTHDES